MSCRKQLILVFEEQPCISLTTSPKHIQQPEAPTPTVLQSAASFSKSAVVLMLIEGNAEQTISFFSFLILLCFMLHNLPSFSRSVPPFYNMWFITQPTVRTHKQSWNLSLLSAHTQHHYRLQLTAWKVRPQSHASSTLESLLYASSVYIHVCPLCPHVIILSC